MLKFMCRLQQNRKSAKKCRMKKKAEFNVMKNDVVALQEENKNLKDKVQFILFTSRQVNDMSMMLYQKMEENNQLQRKLEQVQVQQTLLLTQMMSQNNNALVGHMGHGNGIHSNIQNLYGPFAGATTCQNLSNLPLGQSSLLSQMLTGLHGNDQKKQLQVQTEGTTLPGTLSPNHPKRKESIITSTTAKTEASDSSNSTVDMLSIIKTYLLRKPSEDAVHPYSTTPDRRLSM